MIGGSLGWCWEGAAQHRSQESKLGSGRDHLGSAAATGETLEEAEARAKEAAAAAEEQVVGGMDRQGPRGVHTLQSHQHLVASVRLCAEGRAGSPQHPHHGLQAQTINTAPNAHLSIPTSTYPTVCPGNSPSQCLSGLDHAVGGASHARELGAADEVGVLNVGTCSPHALWRGP